MKKSLVISTIATVLVVVVALTTATFAWFSASQGATVGSSFTLASAGGGVSVYMWNATTGSNGAYELNPASGTNDTPTPLGTYVGTYDWASGEAGGAFTAGEGTNATTDYNPLMPRAQIGGIYDAAATVDTISTTQVSTRGLPNIPFVSAQQSGTGISVQSITARPVVARFQLVAGFAQTDATITVRISIDEGSTSLDQTAARNVRFVLIGQQANRESIGATHPDFIIGTNYNYINGATVGSVTGPDYQSVTIPANTENTRSATVDPSTITAQSPSSTTLNFSMVDSVPLECVLYMWIDGQNVTSLAARGQFDFAVEISGEEHETP